MALKLKDGPQEFPQRLCSQSQSHSIHQPSTKEIYMLKTRKILTVLSVFTVVFVYSSLASAQIRTVLVSPVPNDPVASGTALRNALAGIPSPSSTNRWLLKIEPGIYEMQSNSLQMRSWVDIEGSGIGQTIIRANSTAFNINTVLGASDAELRMLTVEALGGPSVGVGQFAAMRNNGSPRVYRVKFVTQAINSEQWGMVNISSAPKIEECEFNVSGTRTNSGIAFSGQSGTRSSIVRSNIAVSGGSTNYGVTMSVTQILTEIQDTRIDVTSGPLTFGIFAFPIGWQGNETLTLRNVIIKSADGGLLSAGIYLDQGTTVGLDISHSRILSGNSPTTKGIFQGGGPPVVIQHSSIWGLTKTVEAPSASFSIQATALIGGPATAGLWQGCMGVWDEMGQFYPMGCPQ
jgi:hypothetical protein